MKLISRLRKLEAVIDTRPTCVGCGYACFCKDCGRSFRASLGSDEQGFCVLSDVTPREFPV